MGIVYEAEQTSLGRRVALKVLPQQWLFGTDRLQRFEREAQAAARLHHTNIVPVLGIGVHEGIHFIVMQYIDGRGVDTLIRAWQSGQERPVEPARERWRWVARIGVQTAQALQYAHEQGVLHRDIKPANLLIDRHGDPWVTDFGLAKVAQADGLTRTGDIVGTLAYMAPERFQSSGEARSDIYSLGLTLYELLTLEQGFHDTDPSRLIKRVCEGHPAAPRTLNPAIPRDLETIVLKAIACEPERRYATARSSRAEPRPSSTRSAGAGGTGPWRRSR
jgi:serine/threonine protein kinase